MPNVFIEPFDLQTILINYFLGTTEFFIFAFVIVMSLVGARYQMSNRLFLTILAIGSIMVAGFLGESVYILIIFIIGIISFKGIGRLVT